MILKNLQDLKDPRKKDEMAAARATLKKSSRMLLTTSKVRLQWIKLGDGILYHNYIKLFRSVARICGSKRT